MNNMKRNIYAEFLEILDEQSKIFEISKIKPIKIENDNTYELLSEYPFSKAHNPMTLLKSFNRISYDNDIADIAYDYHEHYYKKAKSLKEVLKLLLEEDFALTNYCVDKITFQAYNTFETLSSFNLCLFVTKRKDYVAMSTWIYGIAVGGMKHFETIIFKKNKNIYNLTCIRPNIDIVVTSDNKTLLDLYNNYYDNPEVRENIAPKLIKAIFIIRYTNAKLLDKRVLRKKRTRINNITGKTEYVTPVKQKEYTIKELSTTIRYIDDTVNPLPKKEYTRHSDGWEVSGHYRTYKSGKKIWIPAYDKGEKSKGKRINPNS